MLHQCTHRVRLQCVAVYHIITYWVCDVIDLFVKYVFIYWFIAVFIYWFIHVFMYYVFVGLSMSLICIHSSIHPTISFIYYVFIYLWTYEWVVSHIWMSHVMSHIWMSHDKYQVYLSIYGIVLIYLQIYTWYLSWLIHMCAMTWLIHM